jgi:hypothetical protein
MPGILRDWPAAVREGGFAPWALAVLVLVDIAAAVAPLLFYWQSHRGRNLWVFDSATWTDFRGAAPSTITWDSVTRVYFKVPYPPVTPAYFEMHYASSEGAQSYCLNPMWLRRGALVVLFDQMLAHVPADRIEAPIREARQSIDPSHDVYKAKRLLVLTLIAIGVFTVMCLVAWLLITWLVAVL